MNDCWFAQIFNGRKTSPVSTVGRLRLAKVYQSLGEEGWVTVGGDEQPMINGNGNGRAGMGSNGKSNCSRTRAEQRCSNGKEPGSVRQQSITLFSSLRVNIHLRIWKPFARASHGKPVPAALFSATQLQVGRPKNPRGMRRATKSDIK